MRSFLPVAVGSALMLASPVAEAHPHLWVNVATEVLYDASGGVTGFRHAWTFDEGYTALAIQGLDTNGDGAYDRNELQSLAQENAESLKDFGYFTEARIEGEKLDLIEPIDYYSEYDAAKGLTFHFTLPLKASVKPGSLKLSFAVFDPSYFIAFTFTSRESVRLASNAPAGCTAVLATPPAEAADQKALDEAFFNSEEAGGYGSLYSQDAIVSCN